MGEATRRWFDRREATEGNDFRTGNYKGYAYACMCRQVTKPGISTLTLHFMGLIRGA